MANVIRQLAVELKLQADNFNSGMKASQQEAKEFEKNLKPTLNIAKDLGFAMAAAGTAVAGGMLAAAKSAVDYGDKLNDLRQRSGVSVENLSKLGFAAEQSGSSMDGLATGLKFLARNMESAADGGKAQLRAFDELGVSAGDLAAAHGDVSKIMLLVADQFKGMEDGAEKTALAMQIFGKSGADLIPMLNEGSAGLQQLGDDATKAGLAMSGELAAASDQLNDTLNELRASTMGLSIQVARALLPSLQSLVDSAVEGTQAVTRFVAAHQELTRAGFEVGGAMAAVGTALTGIAFVLPQVQKGLVLLGGTMAAIATAGVAVLGFELLRLHQELTASNEAFANLKKVMESAPTKQEAIDIAAIGREMVRLRLATEETEKSYDRLFMRSEGSAKNTGQVLREIAEAQEKAAVAARKHADAMRLAFDALLSFQRTLDSMNADELKNHEELLQKATSGAARFGLATQDEINAIVQASRQFGVLNDIMDKFTKSAEQVRYEAEQMKKDFDSIMRTGPGMAVGGISAMVPSAKDIKDIERAYSDTFQSVKSTAVKIFSDMIQDGKFKFSSLASSIKGIFNTLWTEILSSLTAKLLTPLVSAISNSIGGALGKIPGLGGIFGSAGGVGLGALFGGGAAAGGVAAGGMIGGTSAVGFVGPVAPAAALSTAAVAATAGIAAAALAAIAIVKSQAHWEANTFVKTIQNPFGEAIGKLSNTFAAAEAAGTLTIDAANEARTQMAAAWDEFQVNAANFAKGGSDEAKVAAQALAQLGPLMTQILTDMDTSIGNLVTGAETLETTTRAAAEAAEELQRTQDFVDRVTKATFGSSNLEAALSQLEGIGSPSAIILDRLGSDIESFYDALVKSGMAVPELIQKYHDLAEAQNAVADTATTANQTFRSPDGSHVSVSSAEEIRRFLAALGQPQPIIMNVDGRQFATVLAPHNYALSRNQGVKITGTR